ncbi:metalloprotease [Parafrankia colletiae]|uniref:Metalloprotease n=1 Tax=Parafrankia colletiae TaxID=573497 RepID=A0A1S1QPH2_9ACTN|nr:neutral zinc metallopeptidase [Parafrankia colletiae]MCK9903424.1 neutral zinc metallopeptidase [Frankia sp. Cpl3]OHV35466.1 metalloprotease [Parafrankia colletiae]
MRFDDSPVDTSQLEDRRGGSGAGRGLAIGGGGAGIIGVVVYLLVTLIGGGGGDAGTDGTGGTGEGTGREALPASEIASRCATAGAVDQYDDCLVLKVFNEVNEVWTAEFQRTGQTRTGQTYAPPTLVYFDDAVSTGCGTASAEVGPFYCPPDQRVFIDLGFLSELQERYGAQGRYAQAYIVAHEVGHHLQTITGTEERLRQAQQADPSRENELSVQLELQADCYAGVWSTLANRGGNVTITETDLDEALGAAEAVGDDRIQASAGAGVDPESWTHGSAEQRRTSFLTGYRGATMEACGTVPA